MTYTPDQIARASAETKRLQRELDITNADHIAVWLETNLEDATIGWLACRIIEAHEAAIAATEAHVTEREADGWESGMRDAANICGSLAETTYDDADAFEAAAGCEAAIVDHLRAHQRSRKEHLREPGHEQ